MKITDKTKRKAEKQRLKRIKEYYESYSFGDTIYNSKLEKYLVVLKKELDSQFYLVIQDRYGRMLLQKFVYNGSVSMINISSTGRQYNQNRNFFDSWLREAENKINMCIREYYDGIKLGTPSDKGLDEEYILVMKKEYDGKYYFVIKSENGIYKVAKLVWFNHILIVVLSSVEFNKNRRLFSSWIDEAKSA